MLENKTTQLASLLTGVGRGSPFEPVLLASGQNPVLGTGGSAVGTYARVGDIIVAKVNIKFGTAGVNRGNGVYQVVCPVTPPVHSFTFLNFGYGSLFDASSGNIEIVTLANPGGAGFVTMAQNAQASAIAVVDQSTPWMWAANDEMSLSFFYGLA